MLAFMDSCFGLFRCHQHGIACKQVQVPKKNIRCSQSAKSCIDSIKMLVANLKI